MCHKRAHRVLVSLFAFLICTVVFAQPNLRPFPGGMGLFGYINSVGVFVIPSRYREAGRFSSEGIARVKDANNRYGFIDVTGNYVIPPTFGDLEDYRSDTPMRAATELGPTMKYGFINARGDLIVPLIYDHAYVFRNGFARVTTYGDGPPGRGPVKTGFINSQGKLITPATFRDARSFGPNGLAAVLIGERWGFINSKGEIAIEPKFDEVPYSPESVFDSYGRARVKQGKDWILIDSQGNQVGSARADFIGDFNEYGLAVISRHYFGGRRKAGVINVNGEYVFDPQFDDYHGYSYGFAQVMLNGKWGYIDTKGNMTVNPQFPFYGTEFDSSGTAQVVLSITRTGDGNSSHLKMRYGYINTAGRLILQDGQYDEIRQRFNEQGFAVVSKAGKSGFVDTDGKERVGWYDDAFNFSYFGLAAVKIGEKWGYVDKAGVVVIGPKFDGAWNIQKNGMALVKQDGKWGHINTRGEFVTMPIYDKLGLFGDDGLAGATLNGETGYIELSGKFTKLP